MKTEPVPGVLSTVTSPPLWWTMPYTDARPRPTPWSRVVKNGSKIRASVSSSMPTPVSATTSSTEPSAALRVSIDSRPPSGIASLALTARLTITCSIWPGSARTVPRSGARKELELDVIAEQPLEEPADIGEHLVQVERARLQHLPPAEREQLLRQLGGAVGGALDLAEVARQLRVAVRALEQQRRVARDPGQQVVEVVGDTAREPAEALELLGVQELRLEALPVGDVAHERDVQAGQEVRSRRRLGDDHGPVGPHRLPLLAHGAGRDVLVPARPAPLRGARRQELVDLAADQVALGDADQLAAGRIDVDVAALVVGDEDRVERGVEDRAELLLVLAKRDLGALPLDRGGNEARCGAKRVGLGRAPLPLGDAVVEADEAPPLAADEDRHGHQRLDLLTLEEGALAGGQVLDRAGEELVPGARLREALQADLVEAHVLHSSFSSSGAIAGRRPLEPLSRDPPAVGGDAVLEEIRTTRARALAELLEETRRASRQLGSASSRAAASLTASRIASRLRTSRSARSRLTAAATSPAAARRASVSAGLQSRSLSQSSKPMKPHQQPSTKIGTATTDSAPISAITSRSSSGRSRTWLVIVSPEARSSAQRSKCGAGRR